MPFHCNNFKSLSSAGFETRAFTKYAIRAWRLGATDLRLSISGALVLRGSTDLAPLVAIYTGYATCLP